LEQSLDIAITAVRVAGQRELDEASPCVSEVLDWCWAFAELAAALSFVSGRLRVRIDRHANRLEASDGCYVWSVSQLRGIRPNLIALEGCFENAAAEARTLLDGLDQFVSDDVEHDSSTTN
jgi:hypothetical protein